MNEVYLVLMLSLSNAGPQVIAAIDPQSQYVSGYVVENCKISAICVNKIIKVYGVIARDGHLQMHDESGNLYVFKP